MSDELVWDSTAFERVDYPFVAFWFRDVDVRLLAMPGFNFIDLGVALRRYSKHTFRAFAAEILHNDPLNRKMPLSNGLYVRLLFAGSHYDFKFVNTKKEAILSTRPEVPIWKFLNSLQHHKPVKLAHVQHSRISVEDFFKKVRRV